MTTGAGDLLSPLGPQDPRETAGYRLQARIGEGGMGTVYLSHTRGGQPVALKVIRREYGQDQEFRRRFEHEVRAARRVQGYHIVPVVDHDTTGELPWLASAFVAGIPLHNALAAFGPLPLPAVFQLVGCTARALSAIHAAGVVHRDLKPSNILLGSQGPYVIDFGIARAADATQLTWSGGVIGTPQYMSPEHALGEQVGPATDVFSLGLIAAVAAAGRHPYGDGGAITIAAQIANTAHRPPQLGGYDDKLRPLLERCLTADPDERIGTEELAAHCQELAGCLLSDFGGWLPAPLAAEIVRREQAAQTPPPPTVPPLPTAALTAPPETTSTTPPPSPATDRGSTGVNGATGPEVPTATPAEGFGPAGPVPTPGYGYPPPGTGTGTYHLTPADPTSASPAPVRRRGLKMALIAAALVLAVGAGAAGAVWVLGKDDNGQGSDQADGDGSTASSTSSASGTDADGTPGNGEEAPTPTKPPSAPAGASYELQFEGREFTLRTPTTLGYTAVDFDEPKADTEGEMDDALRDMTVEDTEWTFDTTMGKSAGTTAEECQKGAKADVLPSTVAPDSFGEKALISKGARLCTVTNDGNLAMYEITGLTASRWSFEVPTVQGRLTLWKITE
ncbi:serine/threonine-protein kinase [Streptomyces sp. NPDC050997]|uniref:serine/threonine-protein kinase n=1 Tax=Streptomyces sp. NPDC050997 TaxID=3155519 RepID=UPI003441AF00